MLNQYLTPEVVVLAAGIACLFAVIALILAGRRALVRGMASSLAALETQIASRQRILEDIGERMVQAAELQKRVDHLEKRFAALQQDIQPVEAKHLKAVADYEDAKAKLRTTREEWGQLRERVDLYKDRVAKVEALEQEIAELTARRDEVQKTLAELPNKIKELERLQEDIVKERGLQEQIKKEIAQTEETAREKKESAARDIQKLEKAQAEREIELEGLKTQIRDTAKNLKATEKELEEKSKELNALGRQQSSLEGSINELRVQRDNLVRLPREAFESLNVEVFVPKQAPNKERDERRCLDRVAHLVQHNGFDMPLRIQQAFHTALKTSDISCLTVMAGVSGTGKSAFPKLYAEAMGIHFLPVAVEPRWDSPHDLFGFLNYMESRFEATRLGRALIQFDNSPHCDKEHSSLKDQMLLVLLDEMNLARIEYYFSEFLSKLEMRRNVDLKRLADYQMVSTEVFAGYKGADGHEAAEPVRLYAGENVLFVGTMNEDESTQTLSDKVIDRANVIHLGRPQKLDNREQNVRGVDSWKALPFSTWKEWMVEASQSTIRDYEKAERMLNEINQALGHLGRPFGHRAFRAILTYIANHPSVRLDKKGPEGALADQVAMRVMPKLRGIDLAEKAQVLNQLSSLLDTIHDPALTDAFNRARNASQGFFDWGGIDWR